MMLVCFFSSERYTYKLLLDYVEHHFARLQTFGILGGLYPGRFEAPEDVFCLVSGLLNFRATGQFTLA
jgi:hypothetical protein